MIGNQATFEEIIRARVRADAKHGYEGIEKLPPGSGKWLAILTEEVGEVAHALTYDVDDEFDDQLIRELIDVAAVATAWIDALQGRRSVMPPLPDVPVRRDDIAPDPSQ
jgi:NTP pyrophosphatase (non-canonical NTP hydrolase)